MRLAFYNSEGRAIAYLDEHNHIYHDGMPVGWLSGDFIHSFSGKRLGWLEDNWVNDMNGKRVFLADNVIANPPRIDKSSLWFELSDESFFSQ